MFSEHLTCGEAAALFARFDPSLPVGFKIEPWAPTGRAIRHVKPDDRSGGLVVNLVMTEDPKNNDRSTK